MRVVLFGKNGGIGKYLYDKLQNNYIDNGVIGVDLPDVDCTDYEQVKNFVDNMKKIDIIISCIGYTHIDNILDMPSEKFLEVYKINTLGNFNILKTTFPHLNDGGKYIIIGSISSSKCFSGMSAYSASKFGLSALLQCAIREFNKIKPTQIFMVNPATLYYGSSKLTNYQFDKFMDISGLDYDEIEKKLITQIPEGRLVRLEDIWNWVNFLISDKATMSSSQIEISGGQTF